MTGRLVLVATPLGNMTDLSPRAVSLLGPRRTGRLLSLAGIGAPRLLAVHEHNEASMVEPILERLRAGETVALVSDAGMPGISDPGGRVVRAAIDAGVAVTVVPGPSAAVSALAISGLPTDRWVFEGFLPRKGADRKARLAAVAGEARTTVLYEAPHRLVTTLVDLVAVCGGERPVVIVRELTKLHEEVWRGTLDGAVAREDVVRGEHVLVLGGAPPLGAVTDTEIDAALVGSPDFPTDQRAAVANIALALGVPKRRVYDAALRLRNAR
jgi:16S rRNA (cytidine1402-2'-O)-methyltransferase